MEVKLLAFLNYDFYIGEYLVLLVLPSHTPA